MTNVFIIQGITGSGKSYIAEKLLTLFSSQYFKCIILSKDDLRYVDGKYVFDPETEPEIEKMYFRLLEGYLISNKYNFIILDNTHLNLSFVKKTINLLDKHNAIHISLMICPNKDLEVHINGNVHGVDTEKVEKQYKDWFPSIQEFQSIVRWYVVIDR